MSQRVDERSETPFNLDAYNKYLKLAKHVISVCKPKDSNPNNKHIPKRFVHIGDKLVDCVFEIGSDVLEANEIYVGNNLEKDLLIEHYKSRIELEEHVKRMTYRVENIMRVLHDEHNFASSTINYFMELLHEERNILIGWCESDKRNLKKFIS